MIVQAPLDITAAGGHRALLLALYQAMVQAASPEDLLPSRLPQPPRGRTLVIGAGKAAAAMARAVEDHWPAPLSGLVVTRYGHGLPCNRIAVVEAGHPFPDAVGAGAAARMLEMVQDLTADDLVLALLSGGGSALLTLPAPGLTLADVQGVNRRLLRSGASITEINCVRKHLSAVAGGRLAVACYPAPVITYAISDVPGDDPSVIASGPTVADPTTFADARAVVERYGLRLTQRVRRHLEEARDETPKPGDSRLEGGEIVVLVTPGEALEAAAARARAGGLTPMILGADLEGEARELALAHAGVIHRLQRQHTPPVRAARWGPAEIGGDPARANGEAEAPLVLLSGGETTVTVTGRGRGGRNTEYLLALAVALGPPRGDFTGVFALAADTDGIDGTESNAGAFLSPDTLQRAAAARLDPRSFLEANDSYGFFQQLGDLLTTGPTRTNVNDFRAVLLA
jgi:glycerate 2-kinase